MPDRGTGSTAAGGDALVEGVVRVDGDGRPQEWNAQALELLGSIAPETLRKLPIAAALAGDEDLVSGDVWATGAGGRWRSLDYRIAVARDRAGAASGAVVALLDATLRHARTRALTEAHDHFRAVFEGAAIGMAVLDCHGRIMSVNPALERAIGRGTLELVGVPFAVLGREADIERLTSELRRVLDGAADGLHLELPPIGADGREVWSQLDATLLTDADGQPSMGIVQVQDVSRRRAYQTALQRLADQDPLTGLLNRRGFAHELHRQLERVARYGRDGALLVLDLDDFKRVNDTLGHEAGDRVLCSAAATLASRLRESDALARLGGDEFAVLLPHGGAPEAEALGRGLLAALRATPPLAAIGGVRVSASVGVVAIDGDETAEELLVRADMAMYEAKRGGRDAVVRHAGGTATTATTTERIAALARIRSAVRAGRLCLFAQPIVDVATGEPRLHELLLRMVDQQGGLLPPDAFMPMAERFDLVQEIDRWVVGQAAELLAGTAPQVALTANVSARSVADGDLVAALERALATTGVDPTRLVLELTETAAVEIGKVERFAACVTGMGCRLAIDDFGAGYGSFQYLRRLPFDYLKIDGQFVRSGPTRRADALIVDAVRDLAHGFGKRVIAEHVADPRLHDWVAARGIDLVQGFHVGCPVPVQDAFRTPAPA